MKANRETGSKSSTGKRRFPFRKPARPDSPPAAPRPGPLTGQKFQIRVLPSDLYNLHQNLIEHLIYDEPEVTRELATAEEQPLPSPPEKSRFLNLLLEEVGNLGKRLTGLTHRLQAVEDAKADLEKSLPQLLTDVSALKQDRASPKSPGADQEQIQSLRAEINDLTARSADRESLERVAAQLSEITARQVDPKILDDLFARLEEIREENDQRGRLLDRVAEEVEDLAAASADPAPFTEIRAQLEALRSFAADRQALEQIRARVEKIDSNYLDQGALERIFAELDEFRKNFTGAALLDKVIAHIEVIASKFADRATTNQLHDRVEEFGARAADRAALEELSTRLEALRGEVADREALDKVQAQVEAIGAGAADRAALEELARRLEALRGELADREALGKVQAQVEAIGAKSADRAALEELSARILALRSELVSREMLSKVLAPVRDLPAKITEVERDQVSLRDRLEQPPPGAEVMASQLEGLAKKLAALEASVGELRVLAPAAGRSPEVEERLAGLETKLSRALSAAPAPAPVPAPGLDQASARMAKIEDELQELRRQIRKAFENLTAHPLRDLERVKEKLALLEKAPRSAAPPPRPAPAPKPAALKFSWSKLLTYLIPAVVMAVGVGVVAAHWASQPEAPVAAPNFVYDDLQPPLQTPTLDLGTKRVTLREGKLDVTGYAPGAVAARLFVNGLEVSAQAVADQGFRFPAVPLQLGVNVLEVKVADAAGNETNSMAALVDRQSPAAASVLNVGSLNRMRGPRDRPYLALTIDAGSANQRAEKILAILREKKIVTTFFLTGQFIEKYPDLVREIVADGHEVGNHTYSHPHLTTFTLNGHNLTSPGLTKKFFQQELQKTKRIFETTTGAAMTNWWRAPYGEYNQTILEWAKEEGFMQINWTRTPRNLDMLDWVADEKSDHYLNAAGLLKRYTDIGNGPPGAANGSIILTHLGTDRKRDFLDEILPQAIDQLRSRNYEFVTVTQMFAE